MISSFGAVTIAVLLLAALANAMQTQRDKIRECAKRLDIDECFVWQAPADPASRHVETTIKAMCSTEQCKTKILAATTGRVIPACIDIIETDSMLIEMLDQLPLTYKTFCTRIDQVNCLQNSTLLDPAADKLNMECTPCNAAMVNLMKEDEHDDKLMSDQACQAFTDRCGSEFLRKATYVTALGPR